MICIEFKSSKWITLYSSCVQESFKTCWDPLMWNIKKISCFSKVNVLGRGCVNVSFIIIGLFFNHHYMIGTYTFSTCLNKFQSFVSCTECALKTFLWNQFFDETAILWWNVRVVIFLLYLIAHIKFSRWTVFDHLEKVLKLLILHSLSQFNLKINSTIKQLWFLKLEEQHVGITLPFKPCCPITFFNETIINRNIIIILMSS